MVKKCEAILDRLLRTDNIARHLTFYTVLTRIVDMIINRAYRFRLYPSKKQEQALACHFGACRFVYNHFLRVRIDHYMACKDDEGKKSLAYYDMSKMLTKIKRQPEYEWLSRANAQVLQQTLRDLDRAYNNFFNKQAEFPRFKRKRGRQSFRVPQAFRIEGEGRRCRLIIPKISPIKMIVHRPVEGKMKSVTISRAPAGRYYASILCDVEIPNPEYQGGEIGIDLGLTAFLVTSDGAGVENPQHLRKAERRLKQLQRRLSRRKRGSKGWKKARMAVARQHEKVANQRADFLHKLSRRLVAENQSIAVEDLHVKGMLGNRHLARAIIDSGWGEFVRQLEYKGQWYGCHIGKIDRFFPSSKRCHVCGYINQDLRLSNRVWMCPECGTIHDRDENASINIRDFSRAGTARTHTPVESGVTRSTKPEAPPHAVR